MNELRRNILVSSQIGRGFDIDNYLTIVALEDGLTAALSGNTVEYCVDGDENWKSLVSNTNSESINKGQTLSFRGNLTPTSSGSSKGVGRFTISKSCDLTGNCNSLLFGDDSKTNNSLSGKNYAFYRLFYNCTTIKNVSSNFLPATTLSDYCYSYMFYGCTSLTTAPELPVTILKDYCYSYMFQNCTSLTTAPQLPATTLANHCYRQMFYGCTSLTTASELPATTLASQCYGSMFRGCSKLTTAPELPATTLADWCYYSMFYGCSKLNYIKMLATDISASTCLNFWVSGVASTGTFVKSKNATWSVTGTSGIPSGWTVQTA